MDVTERNVARIENIIWALNQARDWAIDARLTNDPEKVAVLATKSAHYGRLVVELIAMTDFTGYDEANRRGESRR